MVWQKTIKSVYTRLLGVWRVQKGYPVWSCPEPQGTPKSYDQRVGMNIFEHERFSLRKPLKYNTLLPFPSLFYWSSYRFWVHTDAVREFRWIGFAETVVLEFILIVYCVNTVEEIHLGNDWTAKIKKRRRIINLYLGSLDRPRLQFRELKLLVYTVGIKELWMRN